MSIEPKIWLFDDGRAGTFNQALAIAEALDLPFSVKNITYTSLAKLPNILRWKSCIGISDTTISSLTKEPPPDLIITAGRRCAPFARYIRSKSHNKTKIIQVMYPGFFGLADFALVVVPKHDNIRIHRKNILKIIGAPHRISSPKLREATKKWQKVFDKYPRPFTAVMVGGTTKNRIFTNEMAEDFVSDINFLTKGKGTVLITTSRRTGTSQEDIICSSVWGEKYIYKWKDKGDNPYFGYLALADRIIVTGESVSMCSEACATSSPVYIYDNKDLLIKKHRRFINDLYQNDCAKPLHNAHDIKRTSHHALNPAELIAGKVHALLPKEEK